MCKYTVIYSLVDDFCKIYGDYERNNLICDGKIRRREGKLNLSESLTILVMYHLSGFKNFKLYYNHRIKDSKEFPVTPCYARFIQIMPSLFLPMSMLLHMLNGKTKKKGIYFVDSSHIGVCRNQRIKRHKTFSGLAKRGKSSLGWFFGFKLHMIINEKSEIIAVSITPGNIDDRKAFEQLVNTNVIKGKCFADKGYISKKLFSKMYKKGLQLITSIRKDMKQYLMPILDRLMLRKRFIIETVFGYIKENFNIRPNKHRRAQNFFTTLIAALVAYQLLNNKPNINNLTQIDN